MMLIFNVKYIIFFEILKQTLQNMKNEIESCSLKPILVVRCITDKGVNNNTMHNVNALTIYILLLHMTTPI